MNDPYCGWNIRKNTCESIKNNVNLIALNSNLCPRFQKQENFKAIQSESGSNVRLECNIVDSYLRDYVEWKKDQQLIDFESSLNSNLILSTSKDLFILNGNITNNGVYSCHVDKNELVSSYNLMFIQGY